MRVKEKGTIKGAGVTVNMNTKIKTTRKPVVSDIESIYLELFVLLALFIFSIFWWWSYIHSPTWHPDGSQYQYAIDLVLQGRSPYEFYFPYPPTIAVLGAWITQFWGHETYIIAHRTAILFGGSLAIWGSLLLTHWPRFIRLGLSTFCILFLPTLTIPN